MLNTITLAPQRRRFFARSNTFLDAAGLSVKIRRPMRVASSRALHTITIDGLDASLIL
jgi:hypothetical protein